MKKLSAILLFVLFSTVAVAQDKEKIKGSRAVTTKFVNLTAFKSIEVTDNLEVFLEKGTVPSLKIEADDNLHNVISSIVKDSILYLSTTKEVTRFKKFSIFLTYNDNLNSITAKGLSIVNALQELEMDSLTVKGYNEASLFLNANTKNFQLETNDKSKTELNLKSQKAKVILSQTSALKSLIKVEDITCDLYQKATADIEGSATNAKIRLDNTAVFTGRKFTCKNVALVAESASVCSIKAETAITINANGKSEIQLLGSPKIDLINFSDEVKLLKKTK